MERGEEMSTGRNELSRQDLNWCLRRIPTPVREEIKNREGIVVAGGFIRSCITGEKVNDIDIFGPDKAELEAMARKLASHGGRPRRVIETANAFTIPSWRPTLQFICRWLYDNPEEVVKSFDFTICSAAIWYDGKNWCSHASDTFYQDLAAKRLVYTSPQRNEDAGGSMLRVLKYYQRGYRIPLDSLGAVVSRLVMGVNVEKMVERGEFDEKNLARILTSLLVEVDPLIDPEHLVHLPSESEEAQILKEMESISEAVDEEKGIEEHKELILEMSHMELARLWRFAPPGHPYFTVPELYETFRTAFDNAGGMTPAISKAIGFGETEENNNADD